VANKRAQTTLNCIFFVFGCCSAKDWVPRIVWMKKVGKPRGFFYTSRGRTARVNKWEICLKVWMYLIPQHCRGGLRVE
jgi:hypothetical protein